MNHAIIFAGGTGTRLTTSDIPKQFINIDGKAIIIRSLENFAFHEEVDRIVIACLEPWIPHLKDLIERYRTPKVAEIVPGGETGHDSIHNGLSAVGKSAKPDDVVLICDGVRPVVSYELISTCISKAQKYGSAVPVVPSIDSVLYSTDGKTCKKSLPRSSMFITQAPQGFLYEKIADAHKEMKKRGLENPISSGELLIALGEEIHLFQGERDNIKVTTPEDLEIMRSRYYYAHYKQFAKEELQYGF